MMAANTNQAEATLKVLYLNASHCYAATQNAVGAVAAEGNYDIVKHLFEHYCRFCGKLLKAASKRMHEANDCKLRDWLVVVQEALPPGITT